MTYKTVWLCGDWVESHTALVEHPDGRIELWRPPALSDTTSATHAVGTAR